MGTLNVTEYASLGALGKGVLTGAEPSLGAQNIPVSGGAVSEPFKGDTSFIRLVSDCDVYFAIGDAPEASENASLLPAGVVEFFAVKQGKAHKISVVDYDRF